MAKNIKDPLVTILMPVYNGEKFLREAIDSVLNQTFKDFEFLIINDGSSDKTESIIRSYKDKRIRLINNTTNLGEVLSMNKGVSMSEGKYIARMDQDDICLPQRIKKEVLYLESNKKIGVVGSWVRGIGLQKDIFSFSEKSDDIKCDLLFTSPFAHPSIMIRKNILDGEYFVNYSDNYKYVEDYALWTKLRNITEFANIPEVLLLHRFHKQQIGEKYKFIQERNRNGLQKNLLSEIGIKHADMETYRMLREQVSDLADNKLRKVYLLMKNIVAVNKQTKIVSQYSLFVSLGMRWLIILNKSNSMNLFQKTNYFANPFVAAAVAEIVKNKIKNLSPFAKYPRRESVGESEDVFASEGFCSRRSVGRRYPDREVKGASL